MNLHDVGRTFTSGEHRLVLQLEATSEIVEKIRDIMLCD